MGFRSGKTSDLNTYNSIIYERLIIDLSWSSSFLEGNTYSLLETERNDYIKALKAVYEKNDLSEIRTLFIKSYIYSVEKYKYIKQQTVTPSPLFIKYRLEIKEQVHRIVSQNLNPTDIKLTGILKQERDEFKKIVKQELTDLHIENLIRFQLSPAQFKKWKK